MKNGKTRFHITFMCVLVNTFISTSLYADLARDSGKAGVVGEEGAWVMENALQLEQDNDGKSWALETGIQHTPEALPNFSFFVETVLREWDDPKGERNVSGFGDTDLTVSYLLRPEDGLWPAVVVGAKVKFPTARKRELGTKKTDYGVVLIVGKEYGELDVNLELEFETFGQPSPGHLDSESEEGDESELPGKLEDQFAYTLSADYGLTENLSVFVELFGNTEETKSEKDVHAAGGGLEYDIEITENMSIFVEAGVDTEKLITTQLGIEWNW